MDQDGQASSDQKDTRGTSTPADGGTLPEGLIPGHLTVDQAAATAGVTTKTIRRWLEAGSLPSVLVKKGRTRVLQIDPAELEKTVKTLGRRKPKAPALPVLLENTAQVLQDSRLRHDAELSALRADLEAERRAIKTEREKLAAESEIRAAETVRAMTDQAKQVEAALAEVRQALYESRAEAHELKAQVSMLQDQVLRALPSRTTVERTSFIDHLRRLFSRKDPE
jgi:excisionase family DNA binding protein